MSEQEGAVDQAVAEGGAYEVLRRRLVEQGARLREVAGTLNAERLAEFGDSRLEVVGRVRVQTENNCVGRDIVPVGAHLLFGYNVFMGLKTTTRVADVFGLFRLVEGADGYAIEAAEGNGFLADPAFTRDFDELYAYYKDARLLQLDVAGGKLLAAFQIGERSTDVRVFRWAVSPAGEVSYLDARGERDLTYPPPFDFEWSRAGRDQMVSGRFPHLNVLDTLFVETTGGDLTLKVENNTETGEGIHSEPVDEKTQSLDDATFDFARVGSLVLLKVLPYRETAWRGFVFNTLTGRVQRIDAITQACVQLPEGHGILFPGGYYLQNGEHKAFDARMDGMRFQRSVRSPNGEDVMYAFHEHEGGRVALFVYNLIQRRLQNPLFGHGHATLADGRMVLFQAEDETPTRVHPMQIWQTPFVSDEFAAARPAGTGFMGKLGNAELVRGISSLVELAREVESPEATARRYQLLVRDTRRLFDAHHWLDDAHCHGVGGLLREIAATGESVLDEFEKVESIRRQSAAAMAQAGEEHAALLARLLPEEWGEVREFVGALNDISRQRGRLLSVRELRYVDVAGLDAMGAELQAAHERIGAATGEFLAGDAALAPLSERVRALDDEAQRGQTAATLGATLEALAGLSADLDMLSELMSTLAVDEPARRTRVVESISGIYARLNQARARADGRRRSLGSAEAVARFGVQLSLFGQSVAGALALATDPEKADEQLARLMVQLEGIEGQFGEHEQFLGDILSKREELLDTFEAHKQALLDDRQRRAQSVLEAAGRILDGLARRTEKFASADELNAFFAGDPLILKVREMAERLRALRDPVKADDIEARVKAARDGAVRALRDRGDLFEEGGRVIRLGRHRFSVSTQPLDLTVVPHGDRLAVHVTGTDYMEPIERDELAELRDFWQASLESESPALYRGEYLAGELLAAAEAGTDGLSVDELGREAADPEALGRTVAAFAAPRYRDGYQRGIHDHDATLLLRAALEQMAADAELAHAPEPRALAALFREATREDDEVKGWRARVAGAHAMRRLFGSRSAADALRAEMAERVARFAAEGELPFGAEVAAAAAAYLFDELARADEGLVLSLPARELADALLTRLRDADLLTTFGHTLEEMRGHPPGARYLHVAHWLEALCTDPALAPSARYAPEAAALILTRDRLPRRASHARPHTRVEGLLGEHSRIEAGGMTLAVDELLERLRAHRARFIPGFRRFQAIRHEVAGGEREALRLSELQARPLTSFVRNRLINDVYLSLIGDNLAKQIGAVGEGKRSDLMGLLMLISPPGYGKTTLMEYVAHRLGLVFVKVNGPALGHEVRSLDPARAPDATSRQELEKLNLALEMGNNVMLYVDDIQHTSPEFLQKFISLCDGTRRMEGVWRGRTKTYDLRGKKFCVVMAGNPYTESGELFKIPDMLANRADIYNLGDVLGGMEDSFTLSYIENCLTSSPVLAPLATRDLADLYLLVERARGADVSTNALAHPYGAAEVAEIVAVLQRLMRVRDVVYRVNQQYIASAAQADRYRTEPPFKLQGSYRNMNKLAEKISPVMNEAELERMVSDHYLGEAQLLTTGAEENLLKLKELRGILTPEEAARWEQIRRDFLRNRAMGGDDADVGGRMVAQLADIAGGLEALRHAVPTPPPVIVRAPPADDLPELIRAAVTPLVEAILAGRERHDEVSEAMLRAIAALRVEPVAPAAEPAPAAADAPPPPHEAEPLHNLPIVGGDTKAVRVWPPRSGR
ncbi:MAG TPA: DNA repair ATPase [Longimicrobium sp.]|nr:DNA repair ATPase [Longimicrobium sp.]